MSFINYETGYKLCSIPKNLHDSYLKVTVWFNLKISATPFRTQQRVIILSVYHQKMSLILTKNWLHHIMQNAGPYCFDNFR